MTLMLLNIFDSVNSLSSFGEQGDIFGLCTSIERLSFEAIQVAETYIFAISVSPEADSVSLFVAPTFCFRQTLKKLRLTLKAFFAYSARPRSKSTSDCTRVRRTFRQLPSISRNWYFFDLFDRAFN